MSLTTRGQDVFDILSAYLEKWNLSWNSCVGICTDGAPCMIGSIKGSVSFGTRKAEVLNSLIINTTAKANDTTDILQTFR